MKNLNLRWECYDSRDDYSKQVKSNVNKPKLNGSWELNEYDMADEPDEYEGEFFNEDDPAYIYGMENSYYRKNEIEIELMKSTAQEVGFSSTVKHNTASDFEGFEAPMASSSSWANTVQDVRKAALERRKIKSQSSPSN